MEEKPNFQLEDIALMIGACVAVWGDGVLSPEEHDMLLELIKESEPEVFKRGGLEHRDPRDLELCRIEYMVWLLEYINGLKEAMLGQGADMQKAQVLAVVQLCTMYREKMRSCVQGTSVSSQRTYLQTNKKNLYRFLYKISSADFEVSEFEKHLISKVQWKLSSPWDYWCLQIDKLNTKGNVLQTLLAISCLFPIYWLPWCIEGCRSRNGQTVEVLNRKGLVAVFVICLLGIFVLPLFFTWIPMRLSWAKRPVTLPPLS